MHRIGDATTWDPFPPSRRFDDIVDRRHAHRTLGVSAVGLAAAGLIELASRS